ncbi:MAG TPA: hypothetical protein VN842_04220 [Thermoplasmata archaeon]|nr:hypothetical protein [Thermoplasmata archaeon]
MRPSRVVLIGWGVLITALLVVELAEITHLFTLPIQSAIGDPLAFVFALVFTTILALVGAVFIGIYASARILSPSGFSPFEEAMLQMRSEVHDLTIAVRRLEDARRGEAEEPPPAKEGP